MLDVAGLKKDFPIFAREIRDGQRLIYLDSGATSQKPNSVIDAESDFYRRSNAVDRKSTRLNSSHSQQSRMPSSA